MRKRVLSLVAALCLTSTAVLADDSGMKVSGHLKLWYQTMDHGGIDDKGFFQFQGDRANEWGDVAAQIKVTGPMNDHIDYGVAFNGVTSFGMENHLVSAETTRNDWPTADTRGNGRSGQPFWLHEAFIAYKTGNSIFKVGRQELDTPLAYTEKWNATSNSFEAAVLLNNDVKDTTLVAAWVAKGNGATENLVYAPQVFGAETEYTGYMQYNQDLDGDGTVDFETKGGAIALGAVNKSLGVPLQAWYYHIPEVANAFWVQADIDGKMAGLEGSALQLIGAGVGTTSKTKDLLDSLGKTDMTTAIAAKVSTKISSVNLYAAASQTSKGNVPVANTATNYKKTKLPTASIFSDGMVAAQPDTTAYKIGAGIKFDGIGSFSASYGFYEVGSNPDYVVPNANIGGPASLSYIANSVLGEDIDVSEFDLVYKTKVKDVNLAVMYINQDNTYVPGGTLGTENDQIIRMIATLVF